MGAVRTGLRRACVALLARSRAGPSGARVSGAAFPPATVGVSPIEAVRAALASSSLGTPRAFHVDPKDKDQWEAFVLGLPATLAKDLEYRKKVFVEVDKDRDGKISPAELDAFLVDDLGLDPATARNLAQVADVDRDGKLCLDEFTRCISDFIANPRMDID